MKSATLALSLMACLMTSGCLFHHEIVRSPEGEEHQERNRPEGVASIALPAADTGTAR